MLCEHAAAERIDFAELDGAHSSSFKSKTESTDAAEEVEDIQAGLT
jgi:hypothetical protein